MSTQQQRTQRWFKRILILVILAVIIALLFFAFVARYWNIVNWLTLFLLAIFAGLITGYFSGEVHIRGVTIGANYVGATGGIAIFILLYFLNPLPLQHQEPELMHFEETMYLGDLVKSIAEAHAAGKEEILVQFAKDNAARLDKFRLLEPKFTAKNWVNLIQKICEHYSCLVCRIKDNKKLIELDFGSEPKECRTIKDKVYYTCSSC